MKDVLFLVHRIPYPPNKGDKIRSFHILKHLSKRFRVSLGCFVDDEADFAHIDRLKTMCAEVKACRLSPTKAKLKSAKALLTGTAMSLPYYFDHEMKLWCEQVMRKRKPSAVFCYSSPMAQYVVQGVPEAVQRIMDFVDVDSDKWEQYSRTQPFFLRWLYKREAARLLAFERNIARRFDAAIFVSENERRLFDRLSPTTSTKHHALRNGVDRLQFQNDGQFESPFEPSSKPVVFTGMMDYWPNVDAVTWFAEEVFPRVREAAPAAEFWIVGANPSDAVKRLDSHDNVRVTGRVEDIRPYLANAAVVVAPLRIARGVQNKVLEALAMDCRVVCSSAALAGLANPEETTIQRADRSQEFADAVLRTFTSCPTESALAGSHYVERYYDWERNLDSLSWLLLADDSGSDGVEFVQNGIAQDD